MWKKKGGEDMEEWTTLISNLGFPIACCVALYIQNNKLRESIDSLKDLIKENTVMTKAFLDAQKGGKDD